jgi:hypothetical protein
MRLDLSRQAVYVNDLSVYDQALSLFEQLLHILEESLPEAIDNLIVVREQMISYVSFQDDYYSNNYLDMIDAFNWIQKVVMRCNDLFSCTPLLAQFLDLRNKLVIASHVGESLLKDGGGLAATKYGYSGVSIFYPSRADISRLKPLPWCAYFGNQIPSQWEKEWKMFLKKYYEK